MKKLFLLFLFSGSLDSFSQVADTTVPLREYNWSAEKPTGHLLNTKTGAIIQLPNGKITGMVPTPDTTKELFLENGRYVWRQRSAPAPDTLRAICLVTLFQNGIAHARMGFVVICEGKEVEYMDCRKRPLKLPQVGWGYKLVDPNYKQ